MNFVEKLLQLLLDGFTFIAEHIMRLIDFLLIPLSYLLYFLEGIFYFINTLFTIVVKIIMIFVALFQYIFALITGFFRTLMQLMFPGLTGGYTSFPSASNQGFATVIDVVTPTGLVTVIPTVATIFVWFFFVIKVVGVMGGSITVRGDN